ncbi:hypothetical protein [uncultured Acetobacteroides sp.]|uniref:hypothetical protein n=1 Tax=uncultured Acetobacteroides sp. TaxID=1760811 RepID=UPI0029F51E0B|nr:hypothetical protein [uncultured Acetobacteroides sp.]
MLRFILALILIAKSVASFGQFYLINPYALYTKAQVIANLKRDEGYAKLNADFFFKGTSKRVEYSSNDTLFKNRQLRRLTLFGLDGNVQYDSLIVTPNDYSVYESLADDSVLTDVKVPNNSSLAAPNDYLVKQLVREDSMLFVKTIRNGRLQQLDTLLFYKNGDLAWYRTGSHVKHFTYNDKGWLVSKREITSIDTTEQKICYFPDSITVVETKKGNYNQDMRKEFYYFNKSSQLVKDSGYVREQLYDTSSPYILRYSDTTSSCTAYKFDSDGRHISTVSKGTKFEILYQDGKAIEEKIYSNGELEYRKVYEYLSDNTVKESKYNPDETSPYEVNYITSKNGVVVGYTSIDSISKPIHKEIKLLDDRGRMLSSCSVTLGESADCKIMEYTDY